MFSGRLEAFLKALGTHPGTSGHIALGFCCKPCAVARGLKSAAIVDLKGGIKILQGNAQWPARFELALCKDR